MSGIGLFFEAFRNTRYEEKMLELRGDTTIKEKYRATAKETEYYKKEIIPLFEKIWNSIKGAHEERLSKMGVKMATFENQMKKPYFFEYVVEHMTTDGVIDPDIKPTLTPIGYIVRKNVLGAFDRKKIHDDFRKMIEDKETWEMELLPRFLQLYKLNKGVVEGISDSSNWDTVVGSFKDQMYGEQAPEIFAQPIESFVHTAKEQVISSAHPLQSEPQIGRGGAGAFPDKEKDDEPNIMPPKSKDPPSAGGDDPPTQTGGQEQPTPEPAEPARKKDTSNKSSEFVEQVDDDSPMAMGGTKTVVKKLITGVNYPTLDRDRRGNRLFNPQEKTKIYGDTTRFMGKKISPYGSLNKYALSNSTVRMEKDMLKRISPFVRFYN